MQLAVLPKESCQKAKRKKSEGDEFSGAAKELCSKISETIKLKKTETG